MSDYGSSYMGQVAGGFFLDAIYTPIVETIVFVGFMYQRFRSQTGLIASLLFASAIFAAVHQNSILFLNFFLFGLINFALYEFRKSLTPSLFCHLAYNCFIYGSQVLTWKGLSR
jgi:membrane protease YdiL (CAAX protease family)